MSESEGRTYKRLDAEARAIGTNLSEVCRRAGVTRQQLQYWKDKEPRTLEILYDLEEAMAELRKEAEQEQAAS